MARIERQIDAASNKAVGKPESCVPIRIAPQQRPAKFRGWTFVPDNDNEGLTGAEAEEAASALYSRLRRRRWPPRSNL